MLITRDLLATPHAHTTGAVVALGNFDGVHRGHLAIVGLLAQLAHAQQLSTTVITFYPHPRDYFAAQGMGSPVRHIVSVRERLELLRQAGIDRVLLLRFNRALATLPPEVFVQQVLVNNCHAKVVVVGRDVRFGHKRAGDLALLQHLGQQHGFTVCVQDDIASSTVPRISSSSVRHALQQGDMSTANALLGRNYSLSGRVIHGRKLGRTLGCPTLNVNIRLPLPALQGIWVVQVQGLAGTSLKGVASLGLRPTVENTTRYSLEVHVFDWTGNAYGKRVHIEFLHKLRDETTFIDIPTLQAAITQDMHDARAWLAQQAS